MFYRALSSLELKLAVPNIGYKHTFLNIRLYKLIFPHNSNERLHVTHAHELWNCAEIFAEILLPKFFSNPLLLTNWLSCICYSYHRILTDIAKNNAGH